MCVCVRARGLCDGEAADAPWANPGLGVSVCCFFFFSCPDLGRPLSFITVLSRWIAAPRASCRWRSSTACASGSSVCATWRTLRGNSRPECGPAKRAGALPRRCARRSGSGFCGSTARKLREDAAISPILHLCGLLFRGGAGAGAGAALGSCSRDPPDRQADAP